MLSGLYGFKQRIIECVELNCRLWYGICQRSRWTGGWIRFWHTRQEEKWTSSSGPPPIPTGWPSLSQTSFRFSESSCLLASSKVHGIIFREGRMLPLRPLYVCWALHFTPVCLALHFTPRELMDYRCWEIACISEISLCTIGKYYIGKYHTLVPDTLLLMLNVCSTFLSTKPHHLSTETFHLTTYLQHLQYYVNARNTRSLWVSPLLINADGLSVVTD